MKTQEGILKAKLEILKGMKQNAPLVLNGDDPYLSPLKKELSGERPVILFGIENKESDFRGSEITEFDGKTSFYVNCGDKAVKLFYHALEGIMCLTRLPHFV